MKDEELARFDRALSQVLDLDQRARVDHVAHAKIETLLHELANEIDARRSRDEAWDLLIVDYIQAWQFGDSPNGNAEQAKGIAIKEFAEDMNLHVIVTSQVNKSDADAAAEKGTVLTSQSMHWVQPFEWNLIGSLNPQYWRDEYTDRSGRRKSRLRYDADGLAIPFGLRQSNGELFQFVKIYLTKNSTGKKNTALMTVRDHRRSIFRPASESDYCDAYADYRQQYAETDESDNEPVPDLDGHKSTDAGSFVQHALPIESD